MLKPRSTRELFWSRAIGMYTDEHAVLWALSQLDREPGTPSLCALALLKALYNSFEVEDLLARALSELGIQEPSELEAMKDFACTTAHSILQGEVDAREGCARLAYAYGHDLDQPNLQPFWLLKCAAQDLDSSEATFYYDGVTTDNFENVVRHECRTLLETFCADS